MRRTIFTILLAPRLQKPSYRLAFALYVLMVSIGSLPGAREDVGQYASGLLLHALAYALLTLLLFVGSAGTRGERFVSAMLTVFAMGAFDEYVQSFFPYRTASVMDWMVDAVAGSATSAMLWQSWPKLIKRAAESTD